MLLRSFVFSITALLIGSTASAASSAAGGPFGLGFQLGDPTALTGKYLLSGDQAFDAALAFGSDDFIMYGDWLKEFPGAFGHSTPFASQLAPYVGVGALFANSSQDLAHTRKQRYFTSSSGSTTAFGARIPLGIEWRTPSIPLGVYLELSPVFVIIPNTTSTFFGALGVRYFF